MEAQGILQIDCLSVSRLHECGLTPERANLGIYLCSEPTLLNASEAKISLQGSQSTCLTEMPDTGRDRRDCQGNMYNEVMTSTSQQYSPEVWSFAASAEHFANFQFHGWLKFWRIKSGGAPFLRGVQWGKVKMQDLKCGHSLLTAFPLPTSRNSTTHHDDFRPRGL